MADIAFLLIIFFLMTTVFASTQGLVLTLPEAERGSPEPEPVIVVQVTTGGILVDCEPADLEEVAPAIDRARPVVLYTHPDVDYARMIEVYDRLTSVGIRDLQVPTRSDLDDYVRQFGVDPFVAACR